MRANWIAHFNSPFGLILCFKVAVFVEFEVGFVDDGRPAIRTGRGHFSDDFVMFPLIVNVEHIIINDVGASALRAITIIHGINPFFISLIIV